MDVWFGSLGVLFATWWIEKYMPRPEDRQHAWSVENGFLAACHRAGKLTRWDEDEWNKRIKERNDWQQAHDRAKELVPEESVEWTKRTKELRKWLRSEAHTKTLAETVAEDKRLENERRNQPGDVAHQRAALLVLAIAIGGMGLVLWIHS